MSVRVGLVTVLFNSEQVLPDFFESLASQQFKDWWLYVIDNSPNEKSIKAAEELAARHDISNITLIRNDANLGVAKGNNQGIELSRQQGYEYTLLLNNDIYFPENTIGSMISHADSMGEDMLVPKIYYAGTNKIWVAGGAISKLKGMTSHRGEREEDVGQYDRTEYIGYAPTCFMLVRNKVFDAVGIMDEKYFCYFDDTDFVYRAHSSRFKLCYLPAATVHHKVSFSTGGEESPFFIYYMNRNRIYFIVKNFSLAPMAVSLMFFFATRLLRYFQFDSAKRGRLMAGIRDGVRLCLGHRDSRSLA